MNSVVAVSGASDIDLRVLRQRRYLLAACVVVDKELLDRLLSEGLIGMDQCSDILSTAKARDRSVRLVEHLLQSERQFNLQSFCDCLASKHPSLTKQLLGTARAEAGELQTESHTQREADIIVFKTFGASRRLSERDKRRMANIIATRSLIGQQDQLKQLQSINQQMRCLHQRYASTERQISELNARLKTFIRNNKLKKIGAFVDLRSTSEALSGKDGLGWSTEGNHPSTKQSVHELEAIINFILSKFSRIIVEKECAQYNVLSLELENKSDAERERKDMLKKKTSTYQRSAAVAAAASNGWVQQLYRPQQLFQGQQQQQQKQLHYVDQHDARYTQQQQGLQRQQIYQQQENQQPLQHQQEQPMQQSYQQHTDTLAAGGPLPVSSGLPLLQETLTSSTSEDIEALRLKVKELESKVEKRERSLQKLIRIS